VHFYKSVLIGFYFLAGIASLADESKSLNLVKSNYDKINFISNEELKNLSFEQFKENLGLVKDLTIFEKKDMDHFKDAEIFYWNDLSSFYKKYCEAQNGVLYKYNSIGNIFDPVGQEERAKTVLLTNSARETICLSKDTPIFFTTFSIYLKKCLFGCDLNSYDFNRAEFVLSNNKEKLTTYKNKYNDFIEAEYNREKSKKKAEEDRVNFEKMKNARILETQKKQQVLRERTGNTVMDFYTGFNGTDICEISCKSLNRANTGYSSIEESVEDGWIISQVLADSNKEVGYKIDSYGVAENGSGCQCRGKKYFMQKSKK